jgi:hypothetical protein
MVKIWVYAIRALPSDLMANKPPLKPLIGPGQRDLTFGQLQTVPKPEVMRG